MLKVNYVPISTNELRPIDPSNALTMFSQITNPRPMPWVFICRVSWSDPNSQKSLILFSFLIPTPVSITEMAIIGAFGKGLTTFLMSLLSFAA